MHLIATLLLLLCSTARADINTSVGIGKGVLYHDGTAFERSVFVGYQRDFGANTFVRPELGGFFAPGGPGKSSLVGGMLGGIRTQSASGTELHLAFGPAYLATPDTVLGGHFQFSLEGGTGISDGRTFIGLCWKHLSSAGIEMPNQGRDLIMVQVRIME